MNATGARGKSLLRKAPRIKEEMFFFAKKNQKTLIPQ
jgi:hypothetical protein